MGNVGSVLNMLKKVGAPAMVSAVPSELAKAEKLILPGVGAFDNGMRNLARNGLLDVINEKVLSRKTPILGICLGAQLLTKQSEEGTLSGLGWIDAETMRFQLSDVCGNLKIPHMGWTEIDIKRDNALLCGFEEKPRFYFVHSYYIQCRNPEDVRPRLAHGIEFNGCREQRQNLGHSVSPGEEHRFGMQVMRNVCLI
jgi:glutamine amidotransferase